MRWIAIVVALGVAACTNPVPETYQLAFTENRANTELRIDGAAVDGGGAAPRTLMITYNFASAGDAKLASFKLETYMAGGKLSELTVMPRGCDGTETAAILIALDGSLTLSADDCTPAVQ
jgi:hypothetical protein